MSGSPGEDDFLDGSFASGAGGVCFSIDLEHVDERASIAIRVLEISESRTAGSDGFFENASGCVEKFRGVGFFDQGRWGFGVDTGGEERFVSIDIPQAADFLLVEKEIFNGFGTLQNLTELPRSDLKRIRCQPRKTRLNHGLIDILTTPIDFNRPKPAETADIVVN